MQEEIEIYLLRHAQTEYNKSHSLIGGKSNHLPINSMGIVQSQKLGNWLKKNNVQFDMVFCSNAERAKQTSQFLEIKHTNIEYSEAIEELSQGDWEGQDRNLIYTKEQLEIINSNNYKFKAPNGESQEEVENRMYTFIEKEILQSFKRGTFLIISHGTAIKCLLRRILNSTPSMTHKIFIENTSLTKINYNKLNSWSLSYINRCPHL